MGQVAVGVGGQVQDGVRMMFCNDFGPTVSLDSEAFEERWEESKHRQWDMLDAGGLAVVQLAAELIADTIAHRVVDEQCDCESAQFMSDGRQVSGSFTCAAHDRGLAVQERLSEMALRRICKPGAMFSGLDRATLERLAVELDAALSSVVVVRQ